MSVIPLCVAFECKDQARAAGARWDPEERVWTCRSELLLTDAYTQLRPFVPRMFRHDLEPPYIRPWMVPQTAWGKNLRALLEAGQWDIVRRRAYAEAGNRCRVCGARGPKWPVEADEAWEYDDATQTQILKGVIALCPDCHKIRHWGKTMVNGGEPAAFDRLMKINRWSRAVAETAIEAAFEQWERRSKHEWTMDCNWVTRVHGFEVSVVGAARAALANQALVAQAAAGARDDYIGHLLEDAMPMPPGQRDHPATPVSHPRRLVWPEGLRARISQLMRLGR